MIPMSVNVTEIKRRREAMGLTMNEAASRAQFSTKQQWYAVESGARANPSAQTIVSVAFALGCRVEDLMILKAKQKKG